MKNQKLARCAANDSVRAARIVAEFDEHRVIAKCFHDGTHLSARELVRRAIGQQRYNIERRRPAD